MVLNLNNQKTNACGFLVGKMEQANKQRRGNQMTWEGRDEMNLAEFPIASLSSRPNKDLKTLHFEDRAWDKSRKDWTVRRLTISASDKYGLPTPLDDEVILGLIQLTREEGFHSRRVFFSRCQLIRLLGWRNEGKSYTRLETALKRWIGVTFYYENAWWDKSKQSRVHESFHILERVSLYDRRRRLQRGAADEPPLSMFCWNEVVFRSFQSGYLKRIDMELYRRLESPVAKRLYRLLDKRFYHKKSWQFDLRELACEHVGLSRSYDAAGLKRKLRPAIAELEAAGYLEPMDPKRRFSKIGRGKWQVGFAREKAGGPEQKPRDARTELENALVERGVNPVTAGRLVAAGCPDRIRKHVEVFDWLLTQENQAAPNNPAGYLVQSIRDNYEIPERFLKASGARTPCRCSKESTNRQPSRRRKTEKSAQNRKARINRYLGGLAPDERDRLMQRAIVSADPFLASAYGQAVSEEAQLLVDIYRRIILEKHVARMELSRRGSRRGT